ncbi:glycosyltransferase [Candidatus Caldatribacterium sp. SIUC1]|uniref:glycosyltransferase n=1 Tax=Candidatus Caldatribacterium sp. SIUC1 TaxID=3418365 RepID=UPI003F6915F5
MGRILYWTGFLVAASFLFFSLDDLFWDFYYYFWGQKRIRHRLRIGELDQVPRRLIAILIPAWNEAEVIGPMVENLLHSVNYPLALLHVFVGVYPNDIATVEEVQKLAERYPQVHAVVNPREGPTSKAQNLNQVFEFILRFEQERRLRFGCFIIHDAEDVIHPTSLKLANYLSLKYEVVQLPVFPLQVYPSWRTFFPYLTASTYADEFAENHYRGLPAREASGAVVPSAGTGFVIARSVLDALGTGKLLDEESLTEDYRLSLDLARFGIATHFFLEGVERVTEDGRVVVEYIATREIFPNTLREAVKQKSRWIYGISFQSFSLWQILCDRRFSRIAKYSLYRDWKAKYGNLLPLPGYVVFAYFICSLFCSLSPIYPRGSFSWWLSAVLTVFMIERQLMRMVALKNVYGWRSAVAGCLIPPLLPLRTVWGNVINFLATLRAWRIALFGFPRSRPRWQKTRHSYLSPKALVRYRRRLGDLLLEKRIVDPKTLALTLRRKEEQERLGEKLLKEGFITETELLECLGELLQTGFLEPDPYTLRIEGNHSRFLVVFCRYAVVPIAWGRDSVLLATAKPLSQETMSSLAAELGVRKVAVVLAPSEAISQGLEVLKRKLPQQFPRLGERLLKMGIIEEEHLAEALRVQRFSHRPLGDILCEMGVLWPEDLREILREDGIQETQVG